MHFLQVSNITKEHGHNRVLEDINFVQDRFQKIAIAGETGAGKSTLLKIIAGLEQPDAGKVLFDGKKVDGPLYQLIPGHPGIAYLSQHFELRNNYRVEELLEYANQIGEPEAAKLFSVCRIDHLVKRKVDQLSGGEKQRIALARLLVGAPKLLLLDEPFSNMDPGNKQILKSVLNDIGAGLQITCILTSHDPLDTLSWADEIFVMRDGKIVQKDAPFEIYHQPADEYCAGLFGPYNLFTPDEALLFPAMTALLKNTRRLFIRPEQFALSFAPGNNAVKATITQTGFWGSYYEIEVIAGEKKIVVKTTAPVFKQGQTVYISYPMDGSGYRVK